MNSTSLCRYTLMPLSLCFATAIAPLVLQAQTEPSVEAPKVLMIQREMLKPGKDGAAHEKTEAAYIRAMAGGKAQGRYIALTSMTGQPRALFLSGYPSFEAVEQEHKSQGPALQVALDQANEADGDLLSETNSSAWVRRDDMSMNTRAMGTGSRYIEVEQIVVRPGHRHEFEQLAKMVMDAYKKGLPEAHWTMYEMVYGNTPANPGPTYLILSSHKSMGEIDSDFANGKHFVEAMGEDGMKKLGEMEADCIQAQLSNLFEISPKMSYPPDEMIKQEPAFWAPKSVASSKP